MCAWRKFRQTPHIPSHVCILVLKFLICVKHDVFVKAEKLKDPFRDKANKRGGDLQNVGKREVEQEIKGKGDKRTFGVEEFKYEGLEEIEEMRSVGSRLTKLKDT